MIKKINTSIAEEDSKYLLNEEKLELKEYPKKISELKLPVSWWNNTSNSLNFYGNDEKEKIKLFKIKKNDNLRDEELKFTPRKAMFDPSAGDYVTTNKDYIKKDYTYYRKSKERIIKYSIIPALIFALVLTFFILSFVSRI